MRILEIDSDANTRPRNMESYTPEELFTACNQVDNNPTNGDGDGVAVPEEIEATLKSLENRLPQWKCIINTNNKIFMINFIKQ